MREKIIQILKCTYGKGGDETHEITALTSKGRVIVDWFDVNNSGEDTFVEGTLGWTQLGDMDIDKWFNPK